MAFFCNIYDKSNNILGTETLVPTTNIGKLRQLNRRLGTVEESSAVSAQDVRKPFEDDSSNYYSINMNASTAAHMMLHQKTANRNKPFYDIEPKENGVKVRVDPKDKEWEHELSYAKDKDRGKLIGRLSEEAILDNVGDETNAVLHYRLPQTGIIHKCQKEIDGVQRLGNEWAAVEVKGVGILTSSKCRFFNSRIEGMVTKAIATVSPLTYIVVRDDVRTNLANEELVVKEVLIWEDPLRLILESEYIKFKQAHQTNLKRLSDKTITSCSNQGDCVKFVYDNQSRKEESCKAAVSSKKSDYLNNTAKGKTEKRLHVVLGPDIPYFEYNLDRVYLISKYQFAKWGGVRDDRITSGGSLTKVILIADEWDDIKKMLDNYNWYRRPTELNVTFYTRKSYKESFGEEFSKDIYKKYKYLKKEDTLVEEQFRDYEDLGGKLFGQRMTHWKAPIPKILLLLGAKRYVPLKLITARLSFGVLTGNHGEDYTGINLLDVPYPDKVAVLGTAEECERGVKKAAAAFPDRLIVGLGSDGNKYLPDREHGGQCSSERHIGVDIELKKFGFPMYKEFYHADGEWRAA